MLGSCAFNDFYRTELLLALPLAPALVYVCVYMALRLCGKLRVNAAGWHAGGVHMGKRVVLSAVRLFAAFQPLLSAESALMRHFSQRHRGVQEQTVSEVVVEVIPF